ncbi:uncharacterized protein LOC129570038 [Sitodiplosis mosellana]|uniref:uncharacterized protein LOC129570038 n=1 Tax=Sitodiplosis mosellana TaxID=263140 RepID=UPI00244398AA|nr:uncharacterized protein LOC129570038 [Sitodiplosis mosellana]
MGENRSEILAATQNGQVKSVDIVQAKRKRMMLAEVYVHKSRKMDTDANKDDHFEVFHIYEFDDNDSNTKITPKLSTNCTEPRKIIEVLQNSTGSDTPQLQRLIEKLCAQNKKWTENQKNKCTTSNVANGTNGNKTTQAGSIAQAVTPTITVASAMPATPASSPVIRVKALESMKQTNQTNAANTPKIVNTPIATKPTAPVQRVSQPASVHRLPTLRPSEIPKNGAESERRPIASNKKTSDNNPVKLWNNVIQKNNTGKDLDYLVLANTEDTGADESVFCLKPTKEVIEHATENSSLLKIDQVYECVSDEFVEDLLVEKRPTSASPLLDTLVKEVADNHNKPVAIKNGVQTKRAALPLTFIPSTNNKCTDFRCNICLDFNETFEEFKTHMFRKHQYNFLCEKCHDVFRTRQLFELHLNAATNECTNPENSKRTFICIVDPPVILMKSNKVFAFRCKHCSIAFHNQRNYVQHAQRHAKLFRCKLCPQAKAMPANAMQNHLNQH